MAFPNCKYELDQEHNRAVPETGFLASGVPQMSAHRATCPAPADASYLSALLDGKPTVCRRQGDPQRQLLHTGQNCKDESEALVGCGFEQTALSCPELLHYRSPAMHDYCPAPALLQQYPAMTGYSGGIPPTVPYSYQRIAPHVNQDMHHLLYPKPIYSYSILIFMALKNSKTGSLPVSDIYNFMTEHFPYFKTAPDGWKNSVRHNLSLNKCFEKVENKFGGNSRKGCLWALNPSKVQKMQEELQKWRRKDPAAVRKSMAKPDQLDRLIGTKPDNSRSPVMVPPPVHLEAGLCSWDTPYSQYLGQVQSQCPPAHPRLHRHGRGRVRANARLDLSKRRSLPQPHRPGQSRAPDEGVLEPCRSGQSLATHSIAHSSSQLHSQQLAAKDARDILVEGDPSTDIDALNPSLMDFELQGNLWEVLNDESLTLDPLVSMVMSPQSTSLVPFCWAEVTGLSQAWSSEGSLAEPGLLEMCGGSPGSRPCPMEGGTSPTH
ncbi:forkhead box protein N1-like [Leucoraja erinacea]|uniref:forkhead box protein N1-like n=1 Tax=Leucoraja erinaceus TaxID=7782 RepID=UPI0024549BD8|nr:forkhead box protein N1-like [Leucoraja erinacea]